MDIPLFDSLVVVNDTPKKVAEAKPVKLASERLAADEPVIETRSVDAHNMSEPALEASVRINPIDEEHLLVKQLLGVFGAHSAAELGLSWMTQDDQLITLKDGVLTSPSAEALTDPVLKKQLWASLQHLFNAELWS